MRVLFPNKRMRFSIDRNFIVGVTVILLVFTILSHYGVFLWLKSFYYDDYLDTVYRDEVGRKLMLENAEYLRSGEVPSCHTPNSSSEHKIVLVVKSALEHFGHRDAIRRSWGKPISSEEVSTVVVFLVGRPAVYGTRYDALILEEHRTYQDLVQGRFLDTYHNNTFKTVLGLQWAHALCTHATHFVFVDDDYYVSVQNTLRFLREPATYPLGRPSLEQYDGPFAVKRSREEPMCASGRTRVDDYESSDLLYAGTVFWHVSPIRVVWSKWCVGLAEWPHSHYPPYITGGVSLLSRPALHRLHNAVLHTPWFRIDDVFLGMAALRGCVPLTESPHIHYHRNFGSYEDTIASHGFSDPYELLQFWKEQRRLGFA